MEQATNCSKYGKNISTSNPQNISTSNLPNKLHGWWWYMLDQGMNDYPYLGFHRRKMFCG